MATLDEPMWESRFMSVPESFTFASDAALNLHHLLYAEASLRESAETGERSMAQPMPAGELSVRAAPGFQDAVAYYRARLISGHLLFDQALRDLSDQLVGRGGAAPEGWEAVFTPLLADYRSTDWSDHDQHNSRWSAAVSAELGKLFPEAIDRLQQIYRRRLPDPPVLVSLVYVGNWEGAYTSIGPTHITCSTTHPNSQGLAAVEVILHEASHALCDLRESIRGRLDSPRPDLDSLWHAVLFFLTGEVVARLQAERGVAYMPYLESTGLFDRAWPQFRVPITDAWTGYLDGRWDWDSACDRLIDAVKQE